MKTNTMHLRLVLSASYDLSEVPEEYLEEVREELRARLDDMPQFYAGQGDFTGDTEATLEEWDSTVEETPAATPPGALAALVDAARAAEKMLSGIFREIDLPGEWETGTGGSIDAMRAALAPFTADLAPPVSLAPEPRQWGIFRKAVKTGLGDMPESLITFALSEDEATENFAGLLRQSDIYFMRELRPDEFQPV